MATLTVDQLLAVDSSQLSPSVISALTPFQFAGLADMTCLNRITPDALAALGPAFIKLLPTNRFNALSKLQVSKLTTAQVIAALDPLRVQTYDGSFVRNLTPRQIASLPLATFALIRSRALGSLSPMQVAALTAPQLETLSPDQVLYFVRHGQLTAAKCGDLTAAQFALLGAGDFNLPDFSAHELAALGPGFIKKLPIRLVENLGSFTVPRLTTAQVIAALESLRSQEHGSLNFELNLVPSQIALLPPSAAIALFRPRALMSLPQRLTFAFTAPQLAELSSQQLQFLLKGRKLTASQFGNITAAQFASITPGDMQVLEASLFSNVPQARVATLSTPHLRALTLLQIAALSSKLSADQIAKLGDDVFSNFDNLLVFHMLIRNIDPAFFAAMSKSQVQACGRFFPLRLSSTQLALVIPKLSDAQYDLLLTKPEVLVSLPPSAISALKPASLKSLSVAVLKAFSAAQSAALTPIQLAALSPDQRAAMHRT